MKIKIISDDSEHATESTVEKSLLSILEKQILCSMASINDDGTPHINTAFFAYRNVHCLYFLSEPDGVHTKNFESRPKIAITIASSEQKWGNDLKGLQLFGSCEQPKKMNFLLDGYSAYAKRFLGFSDWIKHPRDLLSGAAETRLYKVTITHGKIYDETTFGKDCFVTFSIE